MSLPVATKYIVGGQEFLNQKIIQFQECLPISEIIQLTKIFYLYFDFMKLNHPSQYHKQTYNLLQVILYTFSKMGQLCQQISLLCWFYKNNKNMKLLIRTPFEHPSTFFKIYVSNYFVFIYNIGWIPLSLHIFKWSLVICIILIAKFLIY